MILAVSQRAAGELESGQGIGVDQFGLNVLDGIDMLFSLAIAKHEPQAWVAQRMQVRSGNLRFEQVRPVHHRGHSRPDQIQRAQPNWRIDIGIGQRFAHRDVTVIQPPQNIFIRAAPSEGRLVEMVMNIHEARKDNLSRSLDHCRTARRQFFADSYEGIVLK